MKTVEKTPDTEEKNRAIKKLFHKKKPEPRPEIRVKELEHIVFCFCFAGAFHSF